MKNHVKRPKDCHNAGHNYAHKKRGPTPRINRKSFTKR